MQRKPYLTKDLKAAPLPLGRGAALVLPAGIEPTTAP